MGAVSDAARVRVESVLRRAGLARVPRGVLAFVVLALAALCCVAFVRFWPGQAAPADEYAIVEASEEASVQTSENAGSEQAGVSEGVASAALMVDVEGSVKKPGLYSLHAGARVGEAVEAAGGFAKGASRASVNLAQKLEDGEQVYIPSKAQVKASLRSSEAAAAGGEDAGGAVDGAASESGGGADSGKVNLNTASAAELQTLGGIGAALSQAIVSYREEHGAFAKVEDLKNVPGIGDGRFEQVKDAVCV